MSISFPDLALGASNLLLGTAVGAGVNQSIFVMPRWFSSPGALAREQASAPFKAFWIPLQLGCALSLAGALALDEGSRRPLLGAALGLYAATWISTAAYFAPEIIRLGRDELPAGEVARRGKRWRALTWGRHLALAASWVLTAAALASRAGR